MIIFVVIVYFEFSIIFSNTQLVGYIGYVLSEFSYKNFGYVSYIYLLFGIYILYIINFKKNLDSKDLFLNILSVLLFIFILLMFQALIINNPYSRGEFGNILIDFLFPIIGEAGLFIFVFFGFLISAFVFYETYYEDGINEIKKKVFKSNENILYSKNKVNKPDIIKQEINKHAVNKQEIILERNPKTEFFESKQELNINNNLIIDELEENKKLLDQIEIGVSKKPTDFKLPLTTFFQEAKKDNRAKVNETIIDKKIADLLDKLSMFKIYGDVVRTYTGPVVTTFEFKPAPNVKVSKVLNLQDDLAMALKAQTIRIQAPIPGKDVVGIEVPNEHMQTIYLRELLESDIFKNSISPLTMVLGKDIVGKPFVTDLKKLPHLLIAGTTGSGKSVGINAMIISLLYKNSPDDLKLLMIDPKMLEFSIYNDIPHLLTPVITKPSDAINALSNMVSEMERRYLLMSKTKTKNIENYNEKSKKEGFESMPYIVVIIDELADLMMTSGKDVEHSIARLAQMARASGIHLIVATQRPSVDVVTGLIKANLPSRLSYKVGQKVDSKIILDSMGAESLLGKGDMLFTPPGTNNIVRIHAPWSTEQEVEKVSEFLKKQRQTNYDMNFVKEKNNISSGSKSNSNQNNSNIDEFDELFDEAKEIIKSDKKTSISYLQRRLKIGYNRSATIIEQLEKSGFLSQADSKGNREILS